MSWTVHRSVGLIDLGTRCKAIVSEFGPWRGSATGVARRGSAIRFGGAPVGSPAPESGDQAVGDLDTRLASRESIRLCRSHA